MNFHTTARYVILFITLVYSEDKNESVGKNLMPSVTYWNKAITILCPQRVVSVRFQ